MLLLVVDYSLFGFSSIWWFGWVCDLCLVWSSSPLLLVLVEFHSSCICVTWNCLISTIWFFLLILYRPANDLYCCDCQSNSFESRRVTSSGVVRLWMIQSSIFQLAVFGFGWCVLLLVHTLLRLDFLESYSKPVLKIRFVTHSFIKQEDVRILLLLCSSNVSPLETCVFNPHGFLIIALLLTLTDFCPYSASFTGFRV